MFKSFIVFVFLLVELQANCQISPAALLDSTVAKAKLTSMFTASINWDSLTVAVKSKANNARNIQDLKPAFTCLLNGLCDHHAKIINASDYSTLANFTDWENLNHPDKRVRDSKTWAIVNDTSLRFESKVLAGNIGYLKIVGIAANANVEVEANKIRRAIISMNNRKVKAWIIDLRYNGGGNMNPMMAGIAPLLEEGVVGSICDAKGNKFFDWKVKKGNFTYGGYEAKLSMKDKPKFKTLPKIAILTSRWTTSSGEIVATAFKGQKNTKFFGEATGGYTTNNNWEVIDNQIILAISTGVYADRNGVMFKFNIPVDEEVEFEPNAAVDKDECVLKASKWLLANDN